MNRKTVDELNKLNREFYLKTQEYFNRSRQYYWQGFLEILPHLQGETLKVLDVGCGNGRFGKFLMDRGKKIEYMGIDSNQFLLNEAEVVLPEAKLINWDLLKPLNLKKSFDVISVYGVMHHIPGFDNRIALLKQLKSLLSKNGLLIVNFWQFNNVIRMRKKIVKDHKFTDLEKNDFILDWKMGVEAQRYCHFADKQELTKILNELKMETVSTFVADGKEKKGNKYLILRLED